MHILHKSPSFLILTSPNHGGMEVWVDPQPGNQRASSEQVSIWGSYTSVLCSTNWAILTRLEDHIYKCCVACAMGYPISNDYAIAYGVAKVLAKILKPLVGKSPHHVHSTKDFVERVSKVPLQPGECLCSYDATALFSSVPVDPALNIIQELLEQDTLLCNRTALSVHITIQLLGFYLILILLYNTYFSFWGQFYEQVEGAAIGSPVSPIVANLYMEHFEKTALSTAATPHGCGWDMWMTPLSSNRKNINRTSWNISIMWTLPSNLLWKITIPHMQGLGESIKIYARGMGSRPISRKTELLWIYWLNPRIKTLWTRRVGLSIGTYVRSSCVMMNT